MTELNLLIKPGKKTRVINVDDKLYFKACGILKSARPGNFDLCNTIPEIGYCGMMLVHNTTQKIIVKDEIIVMINDNLIELYFDRKKRLSDLLLKKAMKNYGKELNYFREVNNHN